MSDFMLEKRLKEEAPDLHRRMTDCAVVLQGMLDSFLTWFPDFTDHSVLHSMDVIYYCNQLLGEQVQALSVSECYALLMACYLHDLGMGVPRDSFKDFFRKLDCGDYMEKHPEAGLEKIVRAFHHELSGLMIRRYRDLFDIPSEEYLEAIVQISRGHRKTDLFDETEYHDIETPDGVIRTAFLSAVLRLADEIDVGADRNSELLFDLSNLTKQDDIDAFGTHESIRQVEVTDREIILHTNPKEPRFEQLIAELAVKIRETMDYCRDVAGKRSDLRITQKHVSIVPDTGL